MKDTRKAEHMFRELIRAPGFEEAGQTEYWSGMKSRNYKSSASRLQHIATQQIPEGRHVTVCGQSRG